jgi:hypothetical protein
VENFCWLEWNRKVFALCPAGVVRCKVKTKGSREGGVHGDGGDGGIA